MPKVSDWKIIATEGPTVDGRKITREWLTQMAESYSTDEYTALIWPEHRRFYGFGENWGKVVELKAEELDGKMRLFAKLEPNEYMLEANRAKQKLFTSIEPNPDYKGEGRCYLMGLAATDSPASTGTSLLQFSRKQGETTELECSALEEIDFSGCFTRKDRFFAAFNEFFSSGDDEPETPNDPQNEDEEPMNQEQFSKMMEKLEGIETKQADLEKQQNEFNQKLNPEQPPEAEPEKKENETGITAEQFSKLNEKLDGIITQQSELDKQFKALSDETPDQRPDPSGHDGESMEVV